MLRRIISIVIGIIALIILFFLIRTAINAFRGNPEADVPAQTQGTITEPGENPPNASAPGTSSTTRPSGPAPAPSGTNTAPPATAPAGENLANTGPTETAMVTIAVTSALGTMLYVRRRQLANL